MALLSVFPLAFPELQKKSYVSNKSPVRLNFQSTETIKRKKVFTSNRSINAILTTHQQGITRRIGNHHPNLWDDGFLQSLEMPYDGPPYVERSKTLVREVKEKFNTMLTLESQDDLFQCLSMVDNVERLGIDRHFQEEIKATLDYVYRYWSNKGIRCGRNISSVDLNTTSLGFRILRLHKYNISSDVLESFKGKDGQLLNSSTQSQEEIKSIMNLFRASLIAFPKEKVMDEAKSFSTLYLKQALQKIDNSNLSREIKFNLEYEWHTNVPRLEARNYIEIYGDDNSWAKMTINGKVLELAKVDFNMMQCMQQRELQTLSRWWVESGLSKLEFSRHRHVEYYFWAAGGVIEPKYSTFRIGFAKLSALVTYLDDIYDTYGTYEELQLFTEAIKKWDPSAIEGLPKYMKITYMAFYDGVKDMAKEAQITQGRDTFDYAKSAWEVYIDAYMQEAKWLVEGYIPTLEEYLENGKVSSGSRVVTLQPILTLDALLPENILQEIDYPSKFDELLCLTLRVKGDTRTFEAEADRGETVSCITCYMRDHPGSTKEEAINYLQGLCDELLKELNWEYLKPDNVPPISKDCAYAISRGLQLLYKERDGFSVASKDTKNHIIKTMIEPFPI
nr:beta-pinene synthase [Taiwania cryptomerioides]